jgi:cation diffusion facilitator family transporter
MAAGLTAGHEKRRVALTSVGAAIVLTAMKVIVGLMTGSLGLLAEAAHSGIDLVAALITYFAVRFSDRPADAEHHYGHGKIENLSALAETVLLLVTCGWIIYEAVERLFFKQVEVEATLAAFGVIVISIIIDISRSRALLKVARKHGSQALEADALHFSTDVWSSAVVLVGLGLVKLGEYTGHGHVLQRGDAVAALIVAVIVIWVSLKLGRRTVDALLDRAPTGLTARVARAIRQLDGVLECRQLRLRPSGNQTFVDLTIGVRRGLSLETSHEISRAAEARVQAELPKRTWSCTSSRSATRARRLVSASAPSPSTRARPCTTSWCPRNMGGCSWSCTSRSMATWTCGRHTPTRIGSRRRCTPSCRISPL